MSSLCPVCTASGAEPVFSLSNVPAHVAVVYRTPEAAQSVARGDIRLVLCAACGHVWNEAYDSDLTDYSAVYDASLHHSPTYDAFLRQTVASLASRWPLAGRLAVEVGCGEGTFLRLLAETAGCDGLGIDPSAPEASGDGVTFWREMFGDRHAAELASRDVALVANRQMLHYIAEPVPFVQRMAAAGAPLYTEVPNGAWVFGEAVPWTVFYEHVAYFAPSSLAALLAQASLSAEVAAVFDGGQYLAAHATPGDAAPEAADPAHLGAVRAFGARASETVDLWRQRLSEWSETGERVVVWGAAGRGTTFAGAMPEGTITAVADNNPARQGSFVAGTGHPIVAPEALVAIHPARVVLTNATYAGEIRAQLASLDLHPAIEIA